MTFLERPLLKLFFTMLVLTCATTGCQQAVEEPPLPDPSPLILDGFEAAVVDQIQAARRQWEAAPLSAQTNGDLAMLLHTYLQYPPASVYYERARILSPEEFRWTYLHALVLTNLGERDLAIAALRQALALDTTYAPAMLKLAELLADSGQDDESHKLYGELLQLHSNLPQALYGLGKYRLNQGDETGLELLERAVNRKGPYGAAHYALAEAYRSRDEVGKADKQLELFQKFRTTTPPLTDTVFSETQNLNVSTQGLLNRGQRMLIRGRARKAIDDFELALIRDSSKASTHSLLISAYGMIGKFDQAESHFHQGIALEPDLAQLHNNFGVLRLVQRRYDEAAQAFRDALALDPDYLDAHVNLGAALESSGKRSEAIGQYKMAVELDPMHRSAGFHLGNAYMQMSNPHKAAEQYLRILEPQDSKTPEYLRSLALAYAKMHQLENAEATLQRAIVVAGDTGRTDLLSTLRTGLQHLERANNSSSNKTPR